MLLEQFGLKAYGVDISEEAINKTKYFAEKSGFHDLQNRFICIDRTSLPFEDKFFDITISLGVLDSMYFKLAKKVIIEIDRVTKGLFYFNVISGDDHLHYREFAGEEIVTTIHEEGTVQSYYNYMKILNLLENTSFEIIDLRLITEQSLISRYKYGRYHVVCKKKD